MKIDQQTSSCIRPISCLSGLPTTIARNDFGIRGLGNWKNNVEDTLCVYLRSSIITYFLSRYKIQ